MHYLKTAFLGAALAAAALAVSPATAMPLADLAAASNNVATETQTVIWRCGWYHCWWRPAFAYPPSYYYYRPWRWQRSYWTWRRWR
jgi:hypothetical protein